MHGEYSDCAPDQNFICKRCTALDEDALFAKVEQLSATIERVKALIDPETEMAAGSIGSDRYFCESDIRAAITDTP
jgi:hypothetical protein